MTFFQQTTVVNRIILTGSAFLWSSNRIIFKLQKAKSNGSGGGGWGEGRYELWLSLWKELFFLDSRKVLKYQEYVSYFISQLLDFLFMLLGSVILENKNKSAYKQSSREYRQLGSSKIKEVRFLGFSNISKCIDGAFGLIRDILIGRASKNSTF